MRLIAEWLYCEGSIGVPEEANREEAPQYRVIETSVHLGPADGEDYLLILRFQQDIFCSVCLESVGIRRTRS